MSHVQICPSVGATQALDCVYVMGIITLCWPRGKLTKRSLRENKRLIIIDLLELDWI